jgi:hypothetical protein
MKHIYKKPCPKCVRWLKNIDPESGHFWHDAIEYGFQYLVVEDDDEIFFHRLESLGYIITTEHDHNKLSVKILGISHNSNIACVKKCSIDK